MVTDVCKYDLQGEVNYPGANPRYFFLLKELQAFDFIKMKPINKV
jgi:hypothetical protein